MHHILMRKSKSKPAPQTTTPQETETYQHTSSEDLLDEIDEVLEKNAEEFVKSYIQKGGE